LFNKKTNILSICMTFVIGMACLGTAYAQETAALPDEQVKERLGFIENALRSAQPRARTWWYGWIAGYSAGAIVQGSLAAAHWNDVKSDKNSPNAPKVRDRGFAEDMLVGSATLALGVGGLLIDPFLPATSAKKLRLFPEATPEERRSKLLQAEELLRRCARREKDGLGWGTHLLNIGANAAAGLVTTLAFHRKWSDGLITFAVGETVSLINIFTQPRRAIRDLENYEAGTFNRQEAFFTGPPRHQWELGLSPAGFSVAFRF
jgi:hypothetical protein